MLALTLNSWLSMPVLTQLLNPTHLLAPVATASSSRTFSCMELTCCKARSRRDVLTSDVHWERKDVTNACKKSFARRMITFSTALCSLPSLSSMYALGANDGFSRYASSSIHSRKYCSWYFSPGSNEHKPNHKGIPKQNRKFWMGINLLMSKQLVWMKWNK